MTNAGNSVRAAIELVSIAVAIKKPIHMWMRNPQEIIKIPNPPATAEDTNSVALPAER